MKNKNTNNNLLNLRAQHSAGPILDYYLLLSSTESTEAAGLADTKSAAIGLDKAAVGGQLAEFGNAEDGIRKRVFRDLIVARNCVLVQRSFPSAHSTNQ